MISIAFRNPVGVRIAPPLLNHADAHGRAIATEKFFAFWHLALRANVPIGLKANGAFVRLP